MKEEVKHKLRKKGWPEHEIGHAEKIIEAGIQKTKYKHGLDLFVYWTALVVTLLGNIAVSFILIPFLFMVEGIFLHVIIFVAAALFGLVFNILIKDIDNMETHHHLIAGIFIPIIALVNVFIIVRFSNVLASQVAFLDIPKTEPLPVAIIYVLGFVLPYVVSKFLRK